MPLKMEEQLWVSARYLANAKGMDYSVPCATIIRDFIRAGTLNMVREQRTSELDFEEDKPRLLCGEVAMQGEAAVQSLEDLREEWPKKILIELALDRAANIVGHDVLFTEIANVLSKHRGPVPVELVMLRGGRFQTKLSVGDDFKVQPSTQLMNELQHEVGQVAFRQPVRRRWWQ